VSILTAVANKNFSTYFMNEDDSIVMAWRRRYILDIPRYEAMRHFGTVGMMQIYFAKLMETDEAVLEQQGIHRALFEVMKDDAGNSKFHIMKDSINVNQLEASIKKRTVTHEPIKI